MLRLPSFSVASVLALTAVTAFVCAPSIGCSPPRDDSASSEQASTASDLSLAREVVAILGGENGKCKQCHGITASQIRTWGTTMQSLDAACFAPEGLSAIDRVNCLRSTPTDPASAFSARRLGLYAAGTTLTQFEQLFEEAGSSDYETFKQRATMPRGGTNTLTSAEFEKVKGWVLRGMPQLDQAFQPDTPTPNGCTPQTTPELAAHLAAMKSAGWGARLADQTTPMFGCNGSTNPLECLGTLPDATASYGAPDVDQTVRQLHGQALSSRYWVRSSADGRYVGYGLYTSSKIIDLSKPEGSPGRSIKVDADYDPYFLPGNDGFAFAGSHAGDDIRVCRQSLLADVSTTRASNPSVSLTEAKCARIGNNVYQSIGAALDGDRYFVTWGAHENDDGGNVISRPLPAAFGNNSTTTFTPMVNDGQSYRAQSAVNVVLPREGDAILSASSGLAAMRFGNGQKQVGYRVRFVKSQQTASGVQLETPLGAEVCLPGAKASFSFDERFLVTHQYVDRSEPGQADLPQGSSNIVIADLLTGKQVRITRSRAGEFALYPHFRADGWLYFIVRDMNAGQEYVLATDVAVRLAAEPVNAPSTEASNANAGADQ